MKYIKRLKFLAPLIFSLSCVEDFEFDVPSDVTGVVVEGYISNLSYNDLLVRPMDPRYFEISVKYVSRVSNVRDRIVTDAKIELHCSNGEVYDYAEIGEGRYGLFYEDFKALPNLEYKVVIEMVEGPILETALEVLPENKPIGELSIEELTKSKYVRIGDELTIADVAGINVNVKTVSNEAETPVYYRWDLITSYITNAFLARKTSEFKYCWATSEYYFEEYELLEDLRGESKSTLFFLETDQNLFLNEGFSVLIKQSTLSPGYFQFVEDIQLQKEQSELFAQPPYNLETNIASDGIAVFGYFGVVNETYNRWYFNKDEVSNYGGYFGGEACFLEDVPPPRPAYCYSCLNYTVNGEITTQEPWWWDPRYRP